MASKDEHKMLEHLSEDIDNALLKWMTTYEVPALNLTAVILARLTWLSKQGQYQSDFIELLKAPENILNQEETKDTLH
jgi:nitrogen fixation-related uncharacterized protein